MTPNEPDPSPASTSARGPSIVPPLLPCYVGVRCACDAYIALGEEADARGWRRLNQPMWIVCPGCGKEQHFRPEDRFTFSWPLGANATATP